MARLIIVMGTLSRDRDTTAALHLICTLEALAETLADLHEVQHRLHQACAARHAATYLRSYRPPGNSMPRPSGKLPHARYLAPEPPPTDRLSRRR